MFLSSLSNSSLLHSFATSLHRYLHAKSWPSGLILTRITIFFPLLASGSEVPSTRVHIHPLSQAASGHLVIIRIQQVYIKSSISPLGPAAVKELFSCPATFCTASFAPSTRTSHAGSSTQPPPPCPPVKPVYRRLRRIRRFPIALILHGRHHDLLHRPHLRRASHFHCRAFIPCRIEMSRLHSGARMEIKSLRSPNEIDWNPCESNSFWK